MLETCNMAELPTMRAEFTWNNKQEGDDNIQEKLDHCFADKEWVDIFPNAQFEET